MLEIRLPHYSKSDLKAKSSILFQNSVIIFKITHVSRRSCESNYIIYIIKYIMQNQPIDHEYSIT